MTALTFDAAWANRHSVTIDGLPVNVLARSDLITNKRSVGRPKDLADIAWLESEDSDSQP